MGASFITNRQLEMCEKCHGESVKVMTDISRECDIPFGCINCKSSLEKSKTNEIINIEIRGSPEVICHHVGMRILFHFCFKLQTIAWNLGRNWRLVW